MTDDSTSAGSAGKQASIKVYVDEQTRRSLKSAAAQEGVTITHLVENLILDYLDQRNAKREHSHAA
jgi:hypothetical protein